MSKHKWGQKFPKFSFFWPHVFCYGPLGIINDTLSTVSAWHTNSQAVISLEGMSGNNYGSDASFECDASSSLVSWPPASYGPDHLAWPGLLVCVVTTI
jgi:hypothetical protein